MFAPRESISHVFAIWLVLLAISPFQMPFATCDLGSITDVTAPQGDSQKLKVSSDVLVEAWGSAPAWTLCDAASFIPTADDLIGGRKILLLHSVLRL